MPGSCRLAGALAGWSEAVHRAQTFRLKLLQMGTRSQVTKWLA